MRAIAGRPVLMQRHPQGATGPSFFQKRVPKNAPEWLQTAVVSTPNGTTSNALVVADIAHVVWAVNLGCLGLHVWPSRADALEVADELRIDLDPFGAATFDMVREAASETRALLRELGMDGMPKTTGNRGIHLYVRLTPEQDSYVVRSAAVALARELARRRPDLVTDAWWKEERGDRVFVDFNQNAPHKTVFGAWSVRARAGGQVSTPFFWDELETVDQDALTLATVPGAGRGGRRSVGPRDRGAAAAGAAARAARGGHAQRADGRAVAAGVPEDAQRAAAGGAVAGAQAGGGRELGGRARGAGVIAPAGR